MATQTRNQLQAKRVAGTAGELFKQGKVDEAVQTFTEALELIGEAFAHSLPPVASLLPHSFARV